MSKKLNIVTFYARIYSVVLSIAVYSREDIVDGAVVAALINENLDDFETSVSGAVVGKLLTIM